MRHRTCQIACTWLLVIVVTLTAMTPAVAVDRVSVTIKEGGASADAATASFSRSPSPGTGAASPGIIEIVVDDRRGNGAGWQVSLSSMGLFDATGASVAPLVLTRAAEPYTIAGQAITADGPRACGRAGLPLETAQCVMVAGAGSGAGIYGQRIGVIAKTTDDTDIERMTGEVVITIGSAP